MSAQLKHSRMGWKLSGVLKSAQELNGLREERNRLLSKILMLMMYQFGDCELGFTGDGSGLSYHDTHL